MFQKCFVLFLLSFALNVSFATDVLEFQSWVHGKKMMNIVVDDTGKIEGLLYKEVAKPLSHNAEPHSVEFQTVELHSKYYFIDRDYTCAKSLEPDFGAKCKNTCFPSYKQKGIDFHFNVQGDIMNTCSVKTVDAQYQGFKSTLQEIDCPQAKIAITRVPELGKFQDLINQDPNKDSNDYFKDVSKLLGVSGLITQFIVTKKDTNQAALFYEVRELRLKKNAKLVALPKKYKVIKPDPFLSLLESLELQVRNEADQKFKALSQKGDSETQLKLLAIKNECKTRFPAQSDEVLLMEICRQDPKTKDQIAAVMGGWQEKIRSQINPAEIQAKFAQGTKKALEEFCK